MYSKDKTTRELHFNLFIFACGHHRAAWRTRRSRVEDLGDIRYYEELAKIAEDAKLDAVFLADGHTVSNPEDGPRWFLEPLTTLTALARATQNIGLIATVSSTFFTPFHAARMLASLDHISGGRVGWNVVTSMFDAEARNHGLKAMPSHDVRYERAREFIQVSHQLWDSWAADAVLCDRQGTYVRPGSVRPIDYESERFLVDGPLTVPRPPQGRPVLFQAGASSQGKELAAEFAEAIYSVAFDLESAQAFYSDIHRRLDARKRKQNVPIMPGLVAYIGSTKAEALSKQKALNDLLPIPEALNQLSQYIGQDCSDWEPDAPVPSLPALEDFSGPKGRYATILRIIETQQPTVRELLGRLAAGGGHCTVVGTPEEVADHIQQWFEQKGADGFNLMPPELPYSLNDFTEHVIPILQKRGLFRREYKSRYLRTHLGL